MLKISLYYLSNREQSYTHQNNLKTRLLNLLTIHTAFYLFCFQVNEIYLRILKILDSKLLFLNYVLILQFHEGLYIYLCPLIIFFHNLQAYLLIEIVHIYVKKVSKEEHPYA